ncbi:MAG: SLBB domain-containing protein [Saprospiraceae bacterium]
MQQFTCYLLLGLICLLPPSLSAQVPQPNTTRQPTAQQPTTPAAARAELERRNIDEVELARRLRERGIDIENVRPEQLPGLEEEIEEVLAEMEAEQAATADREAAAAQQQQTIQERRDEEARQTATAEPTRERPRARQNRDSLPPDAIYGHELFRNRSLDVFGPTANVKPPDSYQLGVGDEVAVSIFGASQADLVFLIGNDGFINPPGMPRIYLKGITLGRARELTRARFQQYYLFREGQFSFNVATARTVNVTVIGEVVNNGTFPLSAINSALNALVAAGGPTKEGSVRNIKLLRGGEEIRIDVYNYLLDPAAADELSLQANDVIFVPLAETIVKVEGAVRRPLRYEMRSAETFTDLLRYAGGFAANAQRELVGVRRQRGPAIEVVDVNPSTAEGAAFDLQNGDLIRVRAIDNPILNFVTIGGEVNLPGDYSFIPGNRLSDLLQRGGLRPGSRTDLAFLSRANDNGTSRLVTVSPAAALDRPGKDTDDPLLERGDRLTIFSLARFIDDATISVTGAVREAVVDYPFDFERGITVAEALLLAGGLRPNAADTAFLIRTDPTNRNRRQYRRVDVGAALADPAGTENLQLRPFDQLLVYGRERFVDSFKVTVSGAVRNPSEYVYDPTMTLSDLLLLSGGLSLSADRGRVDVFRLQFTPNQATRTELIQLEVTEINGNLAGPDAAFPLRAFDRVVVRDVSEFELQQMVHVRGEVAYPGDYALLSNNERLTDLLQRTGGLTEEAFPSGATLLRTVGADGLVVIELPDALARPGSSSNITLRTGDTLQIPKRRDLVAIYVSGTRARQAFADSLVRDQIIYVSYQGRHTADWYVEQYAGGFAQNAKRKRTTVQYPNGRVKRTSQALWAEIYPWVEPGSEIRVGLKDPKPPKDPNRPRIDWGEVAQVTIAGLTSLVTLLVLVDRL